MRVKPRQTPLRQTVVPAPEVPAAPEVRVPRFAPNSDVELMQKRLGATPHEPPALAPARESPPEAALQDWRPGETHEVALQAIDENPLNARVFYANIEIDEMALSLQKNGQDVPAKGYVDAARVILIDGQKRLRAARAAGLKTLRVEIVRQPETPLEQYFASRRINLERSSQTALDDAIRFRKLLSEGLVESQAALARQVGLSEGAISQILSINQIPQRVLLHMKERPATCGAAMGYQLSQLFSRRALEVHDADKLEQLALEVLEEIVESGLSVKQVQALVASRLAGPRARDKSETRSVSFGGAKGTLKVFEKKRQIDFSIKGLSDEKLQELRARLEGIFEPGDGA